ncbi:hypothetical protein ABK040_001498 [Willaertia magna]
MVSINGREISFSHPDVTVNWRAVLAELVGTTLFVFIATTAEVYSKGELFQGAFGHMFALLAMVHTFGPISGGHFNPAVTFAAMITRNIGFVSGLLYMLAQVVGGIIAASFTLLVAKTAQPAVFVPPTEIGDAFRGFALEILLTMFLTMTIFGSAMKSQHLNSETGLEPISGVVASVPIGFALGADAMAGALTGACMNPVMNMGPQVISWTWYTNCWIYYTAPFIGGGIGGLIYEFLITKPRRSYIS